MEGWLYGLFTLLGVLAGGLFSYLGMKKQLYQQDKIDSRQWRRKVRGEPLFKLRDALALMATRLQILVTDTQLPRNQSDITEGGQQRALEGWRDYMTSGDFLPTLNIQYDTELKNLVEPIENSYLLLFEYALDWKTLREGEQKSFRDISLNTKNMIPKVQEQINRRLEEL